MSVIKRLVVLTALLALVGIIGYRFTSTNTAILPSATQSVSATPGGEPTPEKNQVLMTADGFVPNELIINQGDTITFINNDVVGHWPASDVHPSHEIYPAFDPKRSVPPGERWSFSFDRVGVWRMHDHENPVFEGTITVRDPSASATPDTAAADHDDDEPATCDNSSTDFYCFEHYYQHLVNEQGVPAAISDLRKRYDESPYVKSQCHPLTHVIGRAAVALYPKVSEAYVHGDSLCWSGYYHGVLEGIIAKIGKQNILSQLNEICSDVKGKEVYSFDYYNCVHGLGHGLMALTNNELFEALELCDHLVGNWEQTSCYGGVFMENVIVDNKNHFTKYLKPSDPIYPCDAVNLPHKQSCYLMQTSYMLKVKGNDFAQVFPLCRQVDPGFEPTCFQSLGRDASGQSLSNAARTKAVCDLGADFTEQSNCLIGAVKDFVSYYHSDVQARALCAMFDSKLNQVCDATVTSYYATF